MSDIEVAQALGKVRSAIAAIQAARATPGLEPGLRTSLTEAYFALDDLQDNLLDEDLGSKVAEIGAGALKLNQFVKAIQGTAARMRSVVDAVSAVGQVISALAQIAELGEKPLP